MTLVLKVSKKQLAKQMESIRPYKSRSHRPCDFCRRRKTCCIIKKQSPCLACVQSNNGNCTFVEEPLKRNKRSSSQKNLQDGKLKQKKPSQSAHKGKGQTITPTLERGSDTIDSSEISPQFLQQQQLEDHLLLRQFSPVDNRLLLQIVEMRSQSLVTLPSYAKFGLQTNNITLQEHSEHDYQMPNSSSSISGQGGVYNEFKFGTQMEYDSKQTINNQQGYLQESYPYHRLSLPNYSVSLPSQTSLDQTVRSGNLARSEEVDILPSPYSDFTTEPISQLDNREFNAMASRPHCSAYSTSFSGGVWPLPTPPSNQYGQEALLNTYGTTLDFEYNGGLKFSSAPQATYSYLQQNSPSFFNADEYSQRFEDNPLSYATLESNNIV